MTASRDYYSHAMATNRLADKYIAGDGAKPKRAPRLGRFDRQHALELIRDAEEQLKKRRTKAAVECLKLLRKLIWEAA